MNQPQNDLPPAPSDAPADADGRDAPPSASRRAAVTKLAYASPVLASLLFAPRAQAQAFSPPPPPAGGL